MCNKRNLTFEHYRKALFNHIRVLQSQQRFKSDRHHVHTEKINKIALSNNDDKRLQTIDGMTTYPYDYGLQLSKIDKDKPIPMYY